MLHKRKSVLIVDDSKAMCQFLTEVLSRHPELRVVGYALDAFDARDQIKRLNPDVLTLDVEMPRMDGVTFLRNLMRLRPMPVVMLSSLTARGAEVTLDALSVGAVDFLVKRHPGSAAELAAYADDIRRCVRTAADAQVGGQAGKIAAKDHPQYATWAGKLRRSRAASKSLHRVVALGASTGGPNAIAEVIKTMSLANSCVLLSQHMPERFMPAFAQRLNSVGKLNACVAEQGQTLKPGHIYVAPGDRHLEVLRRGSELCAQISEQDKCSGHRPSVDVMFRSVAKVVGNASIGLLLTGMGRDGADGMKALHDSRALTFAQDEVSSAVWGMPGSAVSMGAVDGVLGLTELGPICEKLVRVSDGSISKGLKSTAMS
ncbi:MAG: chemotaxis response regulator protein-glutamate methylesterase [Gammaproteobacteria bacterium]